jgi:uncharacterized SAM-binding protein YcdF (DUF218 family)
MTHTQIITHDIIDAAKTLWNFHSVNHTVYPCDVMLVLGSHDARVPQYAAQLYHQNMASMVICSGGIAHTDDLLATGWNKTEAAMFSDILMQHGVPESAIIQETEAQNTGANFALSKQILDARGMAFETALVVTKPYMERRALATADMQWPDKKVIVSSPHDEMEKYLSQSPKGIATEIAIMVGDVQRLKLYPAQGFMSKQPISDKVDQAFDYLVSKGFTGNLMPQ